MESKQNRFLRLYKKALDTQAELPTLAQKLLLEYFQDAGPELTMALDCGSPEAFHKAFRQVDICQKGYQDMVIWSLIGGGACGVIWKVLEEYYA